MFELAIELILSIFGGGSSSSSDGSAVQGIEDFQESFQFSVIPRLTTPLRLLEKEGEILTCSRDQLPDWNAPDEDGIHYGTWLPVVPGTQDRGTGNEPRLIEELKEFRRIVESNSLDTDDRISMVRQREKEWSVLPDRFGQDVAKEYYTRLLVKTLDGIGESKGERIFDAGYRTLEELAQADPSELESIYGIGESTAEHIVTSASSCVVDS